MLNEIDTQRFNEVYSRFEAGEYSRALQGLRDLAGGIVDPWDKTELLYHEAMFLLEMRKIAEARQRVADLNEALESLVKTPSDGDEYDVRVSLPVMARHADLKVAIKEGKTLEALQLIEDLITRYPKQLSLPQFRTMFDEVKMLRGVILADAGRWKEAKPFLEDATPPEVWRNFHRYYLGHCYYELGEYRLAREKLTDALDLGLPSSWEAKAHYILGLVEYGLSDMDAAKRHFELCVKSPGQKYLDIAEIWEGLEMTSRALGLHAEAENYRRLRVDSPPKSKIN